MMNRLPILCFLLLLLMGSCKESYTPPVTQTDYNLLVVEGYMNVGADSSFFKLSRSQKLSGSTAAKAEKNARLTILSAANTVIAQSLEKANGQYSLYGTKLVANSQYRLKIVTSDGKEYLSDLVTARNTPAVDSISWKYDTEKNGIQFYVSTHDATNSSRYYKWDYEETWEYRAYFESYLEYVGGANLINRPTANQLYQCWSSRKSADIVIGNSAALANDVIDQAPLLLIPKGSNNFNERYSILAKQYVLEKDAYTYWQTLKKMTEQGGSIFDEQPSQLIGNLHCTSNPAEPVIGFISASSVSEKRLFVTKNQVPPTFVTAYPFSCEILSIDPKADTLYKYITLKGMIPLTYGINGAIDIASRECADCRYYGGSNVKPSFW